MLESGLHTIRLLESEALQKRNSNLKYLLEIKTDNLLFPFRWQAGMTGSINRKMPELHGGWDSQNSHIRGTFTGHWLSAAAYTVEETKNSELLVRANDIVDELEKIQELNGGEWVFPIPPEYIYGVRDGRGYWAPFYVCHKVLMGLLDMYRILGNTKALEIVLHASGWFTRFLEETSRETLTRMMDQQETGGLMELWADLYSITRDPAHLALMRGFERPALFEPLLEGKDVLTNMHANTTIPEVHGAARAYEVTEEERYRKIAESYWACAVRNRGTFATGGQTSGEVWPPMNQQAARLGDMNQEHCTVYNMIRLAEYLYRWTGDSEYSDYIERNILNGLYAQGHWVSSTMDSICQPLIPERKLVTYYLPLKAGATKKWGTATENFWCCHCTLVQAHSRLREFIYHTQDSSVSVDQFIPSELRTHINGEEILLTQTETDLGGSCNQINNTAVNGYGRPKLWSRDIRITAEKPVAFTLKLRIPWWVKGAPVCYVDGIETPYEKKQGYAVLTGEWKHNIIRWVLPKAVTCWPLPDEPETVAFLDGPVVLAGLVGEERMLYGDIRKPEEFIKPANERLWNYWTGDYRTFNQPVGFYLRPISQIGDETYTVYFPVRPAK